MQLLYLAEAIFGWVTGCAWTDAIVLICYPTDGSGYAREPTFSAAAFSLLVAILLTLLALIWLAATGDDTVLDDDERAPYFSICRNREL